MAPTIMTVLVLPTVHHFMVLVLLLMLNDKLVSLRPTNELIL